MKVAYLVSRFPTVTETFVLREFSAVAAEGVELALHSLFAVAAADAFPHLSAELEWMVTAAPRAILDGRPLPDRPERAARRRRLRWPR